MVFWSQNGRQNVKTPLSLSVLVVSAIQKLSRMCPSKRHRTSFYFWYACFASNRNVIYVGPYPKPSRNWSWLQVFKAAIEIILLRLFLVLFWSRKFHFKPNSFCFGWSFVVGMDFRALIEIVSSETKWNIGYNQNGGDNSVKRVAFDWSGCLFLFCSIEQSLFFIYFRDVFTTISLSVSFTSIRPFAHTNGWAVFLDSTKCTERANDKIPHNRFNNFYLMKKKVINKWRMSTPNAHEYPHNNNDLPTCYKKKSTWFQYVHANLNRTKRNERKKAAAAAATATGPAIATTTIVHTARYQMLYRKQIKIKTANKREISIAAQILVEQIARIICAAVGNSDGVLMCVDVCAWMK